MARELPPEQLTIKPTERSWRINIETPRGQDYNITAFRETIGIEDGTNKVIYQKQDHSVSRYLTPIAAETVTLGNGTTLSAADVATALTLFIEKWRLEDLTPAE